jgi:hypothetical protein
MLMEGMLLIVTQIVSQSKQIIWQDATNSIDSSQPITYVTLVGINAMLVSICTL